MKKKEKMWSITFLTQRIMTQEEKEKEKEKCDLESHFYQNVHKRKWWLESSLTPPLFDKKLKRKEKRSNEKNCYSVVVASSDRVFDIDVGE
jgi:hypothetical protein